MAPAAPISTVNGTIRWHRLSAGNIWPKVNWRRSNQLLGERDDLKVVIEVLVAPAMLGETCHARIALAIMADATEVASSRIGEEDVGTKVDGLSRPLEPSASARKLAQIHGAVDRDEDVGIFRNRLACHQRADEGNTQNARSACGLHE